MYQLEVTYEDGTVAVTYPRTFRQLSRAIDRAWSAGLTRYVVKGVAR